MTRKSKVNPAHPERLRLSSAGLLPASSSADSPSDIILILVDPETDATCSARITLKDVVLALRTHKTLKSCERLTLAAVGETDIVEA